MFTGLIEEKGKILNTPQGEAGSFSIVAGDILNDVYSSSEAGTESHRRTR